MWIVMYIIIMSPKRLMLVPFIPSLCYWFWCLLLNQEAVEHCNLQWEGQILIFQWKSSQARALRSHPSLPPDHLGQQTQLDTAFTQLLAVHACSVENVLLMSFTVTFCVCGRKHHLHISHGNGICLYKRMQIASPHAFMHFFLFIPLSLFIYFNF